MSLLPGRRINVPMVLLDDHIAETEECVTLSLIKGSHKFLYNIDGDRDTLDICIEDDDGKCVPRSL